MLWRKSLSVWRNAFAEASTSEKPGAVIPHKRSNPCGTPGYFDKLSTGLCGGCRVTGSPTAITKSQRKTAMQLFFATDVHGSEICWKKFVNAAKFYEVDMLLL